MQTPTFPSRTCSCQNRVFTELKPIQLLPVHPFKHCTYRVRSPLSGRPVPHLLPNWNNSSLTSSSTWTDIRHWSLVRRLVRLTEVMLAMYSLWLILDVAAWMNRAFGTPTPTQVAQTALTTISFIGKSGGEIFHDMMARHNVKHICKLSPSDP